MLCWLVMTLQSSAAVIVLAATVLGSAACDTCPAGWSQPTEIFSARLDGVGPSGQLLAEVTYIGGMPGFPEALTSEAALGDAASAPSGWFALFLESAGQDLVLDLAVPLPAALGQMLPVRTRQTSASPSFGFHADAGRTAGLFPRDAVAAFLWTAVGPDCTRQTPDICAAQKDARDRQAVTGTVQVSSVEPLRLQLNLTVTYPPESGASPRTIAGEVTFNVSHGDYCTAPMNT
jgi:hypothetical protein